MATERVIVYDGPPMANTRDLPNIAPIDELAERFNPWAGPVIESIATRGQGVHEAFDLAMKLSSDDNA